MGGILKNPLPADQATPDSEESISEFRRQVLMNTQLNAKLTSKKKDTPVLGTPQKHVLPKDTLSLKHQQEAEERLQWNQKNLAANEITKQQYQDIHIDEPKTPYQGAIDPNGEYYKDDDEDEAELENFSLDQSADAPSTASIEAPPVREAAASGSNNEENTGSDDEKDAAHRRFEEMRKKHYNLKEVFKNRRLQNDGDDNDHNL